MVVPLYTFISKLEHHISSLTKPNISYLNNIIKFQIKLNTSSSIITVCLHLTNELDSVSVPAAT